MFGKTKDLVDNDLTAFFGDEEAADKEAQLDHLRGRVADVEGQISSQFTSMAAYAQIAQEQIELARAEARAASERTESRLTQLIERERAERMGMPTPGIDPDATSHIDQRLDALEASVDAIKVGLNDCLLRQKALADAITALFRNDAAASSTPPPAPATPVDDGPIDDLSLT